MLTWSNLLADYDFYTVLYTNVDNDIFQFFYSGFLQGLIVDFFGNFSNFVILIFTLCILILPFLMFFLLLRYIGTRIIDILLRY